MEGQEITPDIKAEVLVIGGGLAGLASAIHLARLRFDVLCIEPTVTFERMVGESLDWSAPELLADLGFTMEDLIQRGICTYKRHVRIEKKDGSSAEYIPSEWLGEPPFNVELRTLHVDRLQLHEELMRVANAHGARMLHDRVTEVLRQNNRITSVKTGGGATISAHWFVDASGFAASVIGRSLALPEVSYGPRKVAFWAYLSNAPWQEGTTLYTDVPQRGYMNWAWQIPVNPQTVSLGYVLRAEDLKQKRVNQTTTEQVYRKELSRFQPLSGTNLEDTAPISATTFRCRTYRRACGPNWILVGEAASVPDPITGNGVTAALRHAAEGARLIAKARRRDQIPLFARWIYNMRVRQMGKFFNSLIEKLAYDWPIRDRLGIFKAGDAYTIPAWLTNNIYSRIQPFGALSTLVFCGVLCCVRAVTWCAYHVCKSAAILAAPRADLVPCM